MPERLGVIDPLKFQRLCWPHVRFYDKQREIIYSVVHNKETLAVAGNQLGKDFVSAFICLWFFLSRWPCRVVTTSVDQGQLEKVLWGEIYNFINTSEYPLPLKVNHLDIQRYRKGQLCKKSYLIGRVAAKTEGLLGHHLPIGQNGQPSTLMIYDEASGIDDLFKQKTDTWAKRTLTIGNPYPCENFFKNDAKAGDLVTSRGKTIRKVIRITGADSPNVRYGMAQEAAGVEPDNRILIPGVLDYEEYLVRRETWEPIRQCISLDATFYEGAEYLWFPPQWLDRAENVARDLRLQEQNGLKRKAKRMGVDPGEGGADTVWCVIDEYGIIELLAKKTPDTSDIPKTTIALARKHGLTPDCIFMDTGGGGKQHGDILASQGYKIKLVGFGESVKPPKKRSMTSLDEHQLNVEEAYTYKNRRAEMYGLTRSMLDPAYNPQGFGIPAEHTELRRQMAPIPLMLDGEGRLELPPKNKKTIDKMKPPGSVKQAKKTLTELIGCSPDHADALALAVYGLKRGRVKKKIGLRI